MNALNGLNVKMIDEYNNQHWRDLDSYISARLWDEIRQVRHIKLVLSIKSHLIDQSLGIDPTRADGEAVVPSAPRYKRRGGTWAWQNDWASPNPQMRLTVSMNLSASPFAVICQPCCIDKLPHCVVYAIIDRLTLSIYLFISNATTLCLVVMSWLHTSP